MRVKILPPHGCDRSALDARSWAELPEGSRVRDALRLIRCGPLKAKLLLLSGPSFRAHCQSAEQKGKVPAKTGQSEFAGAFCFVFTPERVSSAVGPRGSTQGETGEKQHGSAGSLNRTAHAV